MGCARSSAGTVGAGVPRTEDSLADLAPPPTVPAQHVAPHPTHHKRPLRAPTAHSRTSASTSAHTIDVVPSPLGAVATGGPQGRGGTPTPLPRVPAAVAPSLRRAASATPASPDAALAHAAAAAAAASNGTGPARGTSGAMARRSGPRSTINFTLGDVIARGGSGLVYLALNQDTGALMVAKALDLETARVNVKTLANEVRLLRRLKHPNIVSYIGTQVHHGVAFIFTDWVSGGSLRRLIRKFGPLDEELLCRYARHILSGLQHLHDNGVVHGDIKPDNLLVDTCGVVKVADFGASRQLRPGVTSPHHNTKVTGTPPYMSPELVTGRCTNGRASDVWALGCTLLELATGSRPWAYLGLRDVAEMMLHIGRAQAAPPIPSHLSPGLCELLAMCLRVDPAQRPTLRELQAVPYLRASPSTPLVVAGAQPSRAARPATTLAPVPEVPSPVQPPSQLAGNFISGESDGPAVHPRAAGAGSSPGRIKRHASAAAVMTQPRSSSIARSPAWVDGARPGADGVGVSSTTLSRGTQPSVAAFEGNGAGSASPDGGTTVADAGTVTSADDASVDDVVVTVQGGRANERSLSPRQPSLCLTDVMPSRLSLGTSLDTDDVSALSGLDTGSFMWGQIAPRHAGSNASDGEGHG